MVPTRSFYSAGARRQIVPRGTQGTSRPLLQGVSGGLVQDQCGIGNTNINFLAHSSLVALVYIPPSRLSILVVINHFHLQVPQRGSDLSPETSMRTKGSKITCAACIVGESRSIFVKTVTPTLQPFPRLTMPITGSVWSQ